jgi:SAM-dependent methyltransferase
VDVLTSIYLFHEVPPKVRRIIAKEWARVLKPGGRLIFMDSLQLGDTEGYDGMLQSFPVNFHEPYYGSYIKEDLAGIFEEAGLDPCGKPPGVPVQAGGVRQAGYQRLAMTNLRS